jgi:hypothetical protein
LAATSLPQPCLPLIEWRQIFHRHKEVCICLGGAVIVTGFAAAQTAPFNFEIFMKWESSQHFGTIIPPLLFNAVSTNRNWSWEYRSALELPVSVLMAYFY